MQNDKKVWTDQRPSMQVSCHVVKWMFPASSRKKKRTNRSWTPVFFCFLVSCWHTLAAPLLWINQLRWSDVSSYPTPLPPSLCFATKLIKNGMFCLTWPVPVTVLTLFGGPGWCQQEWLQQRLLKRRLISMLQNNTREQSRSCLLKHIREVDSPPKAPLSQTRRRALWSQGGKMHPASFC